MDDIEKRWSYLCQPVVDEFLHCAPEEKQIRYVKRLSEKEQEVLALSLMNFYMPRGSFLQFLCHCDAMTPITLRALNKIKADVVKALLRESYQIVAPILRQYPQCTMQELLHHLTEAEKQRLYQLDLTYQKSEQQLLLQAFHYYAG